MFGNERQSVVSSIMTDPWDSAFVMAGERERYAGSEFGDSDLVQKTKLDIVTSRLAVWVQSRLCSFTCLDASLPPVMTLPDRPDPHDAEAD